MKRFLQLLFRCIAVVATAIVVIVVYLQTAYINRIVDAQDAHARTALILGASVLQNGEPSDALRDRLDVGIHLYHTGAAQQLLLTGDDGSYHAAEIEIMKRYVLGKNIPETAVLTDGRGYRTYESCRRAKEFFGLYDVIVVTQRFHMGRALYLCNRLGLDARGVTADLQTYQKIKYFWLRDFAASVAAWWDINIITPKPPVAE